MSSFRSVGRIRRMRYFAEAHDAYHDIKPIRGGDVRPIGDRRNTQYQVTRKTNDTGGYTYYAKLYETDLITYHPDNTLEIALGSWTSALSMDFIGTVLGIKAWRTRGNCVFEINGVPYTIKAREQTLQLRATQTGYEVLNSPKHRQWVINRTGANEVRASVSEFRGYLKAFVNLREIEYTRWGDTHKIIELSVDELAETLGTYERHAHDPLNKYTCVDIRPYYQLHRKGNPIQQPFFEQIKNDQPEEGKALNFYKAALGLFAGQRHSIAVKVPNGPDVEGFSEHETKGYMDILDEILFKLFATKVFVAKDVPEGKVPSGKYDDWVGFSPNKQD
jgi:hypothetical protein